MTHEPPLPLSSENAASAPVTKPALTQPSETPLSQAQAAPSPDFLTMRQLAAALGVSRRTLTTWNQRRIIPSVRVGRVRRYELEQVRHALRSHGQAEAGASSSAATSSLHRPMGIAAEA